MRPVARCTLRLTRTELLLGLDQFEPHNFRQFSSTEQSFFLINDQVRQTLQLGVLSELT